MRLVMSLDSIGTSSSMPELQHQILHALAAEDAQQIVLQREIEAGTAGVALAAGASAQLIVDAPRLVALGADDVQAAQRDDFVVLAIGLGLVLLKDFVPLGAFGRSDRGGLVAIGILALLAEHAPWS